MNMKFLAVVIPLPAIYHVPSTFQAIHNAIFCSSTTLSYKPLQHVITYDNGWIFLEHVLHKISHHIGGKAEDMQKQIYDMRIISSKYMASFINISYILDKNIILSTQFVSPNLLIEQVLPNSCPAKAFLLFLASNTPISFIFNVNVEVQFPMIKTS